MWGEAPGQAPCSAHLGPPMGPAIWATVSFLCRQDMARHSRLRRFRAELHRPLPNPPGQAGVLPWQLRVWQAGQGRPVEEIQGRGPAR